MDSLDNDNQVKEDNQANDNQVNDNDQVNDEDQEDDEDIDQEQKMIEMYLADGGKISDFSGCKQDQAEKVLAWVKKNVFIDDGTLVYPTYIWGKRGMYGSGYQCNIGGRFHGDWYADLTVSYAHYYYQYYYTNDDIPNEDVDRLEICHPYPDVVWSYDFDWPDPPDDFCDDDPMAKISPADFEALINRIRPGKRR